MVNGAELLIKTTKVKVISPMWSSMFNTPALIGNSHSQWDTIIIEAHTHRSLNCLLLITLNVSAEVEELHRFVEDDSPNLWIAHNVWLCVVFLKEMYLQNGDCPCFYWIVEEAQDSKNNLSIRSPLG